MSRLHNRLRAELSRLAERGELRELRTARGVDFSSNDYLGLSRHPEVLAAMARAVEQGIPAGAAGSRLLSGTHGEHLEAEECFARFVGRERSLLFSSGFAANLALLSALPSRRDLLVLDAAAHASLKEGARASLAVRRTFRHNDIADLEHTLRDRDRYEEAFIVVEGIYSMDGDRAPMEAIADIAGRYDARVIVDEAHATGLFGEHLRGVHDCPGLAPPLISVHPCGKALGASGAFIAGDAEVIDYLINKARPFLFSTAPPPVYLPALTAAIELLPGQRQVAARLLDTAALLRERLGVLRRWRVHASEGPIVPVLIGEAAEAGRASELLWSREGFDVRPVRPPTVPAGTSRLRISLTASIGEELVMRLADAVLEAEGSVAAGSGVVAIST